MVSNRPPAGGAPFMNVTTLLWDLGGVVLTNAWDREQRIKVLNEFGITSKDELDEFGDRHREAAPLWEIGKCTIDDYLFMTLFGFSQTVSKETFREKMFAQSDALPGLEVLKRVKASDRYFLITLNNESKELNEYRIDRFGLREYFSAFFSSCYLNMMKPNPKMYQTVLQIIQRSPDECLFIDDRQQNVESAKRLGLHAIHYADNTALLGELHKLGIDV
jgi:putative hydrolase of the HAD superfamily